MFLFIKIRRHENRRAELRLHYRSKTSKKFPSFASYLNEGKIFNSPLASSNWITIDEPLLPAIFQKRYSFRRGTDRDTERGRVFYWCVPLLQEVQQMFETFSAEWYEVLIFQIASPVYFAIINRFLFFSRRSPLTFAVL